MCLSQKSGLTQAIALLIIEAAALIGVSVIRPYMDKTSNSMHIAICVVQFLNAVFLLIFTDVFDGPGLLIGVCGVIFFFLNVIFVFVLLIIVLVASTLSVIRKDPETRYQPMGDNRGSFIKSQTTLMPNSICSLRQREMPVMAREATQRSRCMLEMPARVLL